MEGKRKKREREKKRGRKRDLMPVCRE